MNEDIKTGKGKIEEKNEAVTKKGDKYWKFKIDGSYYSAFEYAAGLDVSVGMDVNMVWTETPNPKNANSPYRNLKSIYQGTDPIAGKSDEELANTQKEVDRVSGGNRGGVIASKSTSYGSMQETRERKIIKQAVLKAAASIVPRGTPTKGLISYAEDLIKWVNE